MKTLKSFKSKVNEEMLSGATADNYAERAGIDIKKRSGKGPSELTNGGPVESSLVDIIKDLEQMTGFQFTITGGNDQFHQNLKGDSRHKSGRAVDVTFPEAGDKNARKKVEDSILTLMLSGKYSSGNQRIGAINEYDRPTGHATGGHFHISLGADDWSRDGWECLLPLNGITTYAQVRKVANSGSKVWKGGAVPVEEVNEPTSNRRIKKKFKFFSKDDKKTLIAIRKEENQFTIRSKQREDYGKILREGSNIIWDRGGQRKDITSDPLGQSFKILFEKEFSKQTIGRSNASLNLSQIGDDEAFYEAILQQIGANPTEEKMKFFYAWRKAEGGRARNNPFNTTYNLSKDSGQSNYNTAGVKNYSSPDYGIEATANTLKLRYYTDIVNMLRDDNITADQIAASPSLKTWGTGGLVAKVLNTSTITPPPIYT